jgi:flagellar basal body-associated protein FliL
MLTNRFSKIIVLLVVIAIALVTVSFVNSSSPAYPVPSNSLLDQRRGEWMTGASAQQAYLDQRNGEQTTGNLVSPQQAYLDQRIGEQTTGVNIALAYLDYRRGEWSGK